MPIARTVNGLVTELTFDHYDPQYQREGFWSNNQAHITDDYETKAEGAAAQKVYGNNSDPSFPGRAFYWRGRVMMSAGYRAHIWHKSTDDKHLWSIRFWGKINGGYPTALYHDDWPLLFGPRCAVEDWTMYKTNVPDKLDGLDYTQQLNSHFIISYGYGVPYNDWIDHFVVSTTRYLTVTGLNPGQKVMIYRTSDNVLIAQATCAEGQTQIVVDIDDQDYPLYLYFKVYAADGTTLIETTQSYRMSGGDTWYWTSPYGSLTIESTAFIIIREAGSGSPKSATITATLKTQEGAPAPGKTIYFTTSTGAVDPTSDVTDSNGEVTTTLTSTEHGLVVVKANWPGDPDIPAAAAWAVHHVLYTEEVADASKKFQLWIEGVELDFVDGAYALSTETNPQPFEVEIPEWNSEILPRSLVSIYRLGTKEFSGVLTKIDRTLSDSPRVILGGTDSKSLLETRVVTLKDYSSKTLAYILDELLDSYPCGVTLRDVEDYPTALSITFADETLVSSISRLCSILGLVYRLTANLELDVKSSFGETVAATFEQGHRLFTAQATLDYRTVLNSIRMRGSETLVSTTFDPASIDEIGLIEDVAFQKSLSDQSMLDIAAAAELARKVAVSTEIKVEVLDDYDRGSWSIDDWITLTSADCGLSGTYRVVKILRRMTDPTYAQIDCTNRVEVELADLFDRLRRELKDLNAKTTI